jgi:hypothetical protein
MLRNKMLPGLLITFLIVVAVIAGSGCLDIVEKLSGERWAAYDLDHQVTPEGSTPGAIKSFTMKETYSASGEEWRYTVTGTVAGLENAQIQTIRRDSSNNTESIVTNTVECHRVAHHVTIDYANSGAPHPDWVDVTLWIPTSTLQGEDDYYWVYVKATYVDSDGKTGLWSYYLTDAMKAERESNPNISFKPYKEGDFYGFDEGVFWGLYGWIWQGFSLFAEGGVLFLEEASGSAEDYAFSCAETTRNVGQYQFNAWTLTLTYQGNEFQGVLTPDLPLSIYVDIRLAPDDGSRHFTYELTNITLE